MAVRPGGMLAESVKPAEPNAVWRGDTVSHDLLQLVAEYKRLDKKRLAGPLTDEEQQRWRLLNAELARLLGKSSSSSSSSSPPSPSPPSSAVASPSSPAASEVPYTRADLRVDAQLEVSFPDDVSFGKAFIRNISGGGIYVETDRKLRVGNVLALSIVVEEPPRKLPVVGKVVWANETSTPGTRIPPGVGVKFVEISGAVRQVIAQLVHEAADRLANKP